MAQADLTLRDYLRILRRRKAIVLLAPVLFGAAAFAMATVQAPKPLYRAPASVAFERTVSMAALLGMVAVHPAGDVETQVGVIKGFPVLSAAARRLGLIPRDATTETIHGTPAYLGTIQELEERVEVKRVASTSLIEIGATSPDPREAARLANGIVEAFREYNLDVRNRQAREAKAFIEQELRAADTRLRQAEEALIGFKQARGVWSLPDEMRASLSRLAALEADHATVGRAVEELEGQIRLLEAGPAEGRPVGFLADADDPTLSALYAALSDRMRERENLLLALLPAHPRVKAVDSQIGQVRERLREVLGAKVRALGTRAGELRRAAGRLRAEISVLPETALELARIEREVKVAERIFSLLKEKHQEALIKDKEQVTEVSLVRPAVPPSEPINPPKPLPKAAVGLVLGLVVGLVLAFVAETLDTSIGAIDDVETLLETRVRGVIPHLDIEAEFTKGRGAPVAVDEATAERRAFLISLFLPRSRVVEAFRALRTYLLSSGLEPELKTLLVTSATQREGKTVVAINLAIALAQLRKRTLLIEADLRNPSIHRAFGIQKAPGLTELLTRRARPDEAVRSFVDLAPATPALGAASRQPNLSTLFLLPAGELPPNPTELLGGPEMAEVLAEFRQQYDYVVIDCGPVLPVADPAILGARVDGTLIVVRVERVARTALRRAKTLLESAGGRIVGACLTGVRAELGPDYAYLSYYHDGRQGTGTGRRAAAAASWAGILTAALRIGAALFLVVALGALATSARRAGLLALPAFPGWALVSGSSAPATSGLPADPGPPRAAGMGEAADAIGPRGEAPAPEVDAPGPPEAPAEPAAPNRPEAPTIAGYTVQVHAFRSPKGAELAVARYQERDLPAFSAPVDLGGRGRWWRVYVGRFETRREAEAFGRELAARDGVNGFQVVWLEHGR